MAVFRVEKNANYSVMANYHFKDKTLSWKAKGILSNMLSLPDDWDYSLAGLTTLASDGQSATRSAIKELEERGYLIRRPIRESGKIIDWEYIIYEYPQLVNPLVENPQVENQTQLNIYNKNIKEKNIYNTHTEKQESKNPQADFFERWNISTDDIDGRCVAALSGMDFEKLSKAVEESKNYLQVAQPARFSTFYIKNYKRIIAGFYKDDNHKKSDVSNNTRHKYDMDAIKNKNETDLF